MLTPALWVREFDFDVDGAAFDWIEADVDVADLENLGLLIVSAMHEEHIFREVRLVTSTLFRFLFLLGDINTKILIRAGRTDRIMALVSRFLVS